MPTRYFRAELEGRTEVRSSQTRAYVACYRGRDGVTWTQNTRNIPAGAPSANAVEIDEKAYRAVLEAREVKRAGSPQAAALQKARRLLIEAQRDQWWAGQTILAYNLARTGATVAERRDETCFSLSDARMPEEQERAYLVIAQQRQAKAYARIAQRMRDIAKLEAAG